MNQMQWENDNERLDAIGNAMRAKFKLQTPAPVANNSAPVANFSANPVANARSMGGASPNTSPAVASNKSEFELILESFQNAL